MPRHFFATSRRALEFRNEGESYWPGQFPSNAGDRNRHFRAALVRIVAVLAVVGLTFGGLIGLALSTAAK